MRKLLVNILVFWVGMCLSQDDKETKRYEGTTEPYKVMLKPNPLELFEPFERINFEDSKIVLKTDATVKICHHPNFKCMAKLNNPAPVCAYTKGHGLFNYEDICKIHIENCLAQPLNTGYVYGVPTEHDVIFYNGKEKNCHYYFKQAKNSKDAIRLYYEVAHETVNNDL
nr:uncharacterized protein LOC110374294 [Helicoverpa armigera]